MLVLTRKLNESIVINDKITITVVEIRGDRVRLGITAPSDVPVFREELLGRDRAPKAPAQAATE
jgi:carbon storage regulator